VVVSVLALAASFYLRFEEHGLADRPPALLLILRILPR
jgi:hypothetical protein